MISLRLVVDSYIPELAREDVPQTLRGKRAVIFGNIEKIYEFHNCYFLDDISKCENDPFKIGQCFLKHVSNCKTKLVQTNLAARNDERLTVGKPQILASKVNCFYLISK